MYALTRYLINTRNQLPIAGYKLGYNKETYEKHISAINIACTLGTYTNNNTNQVFKLPKNKLLEAKML